MKDMGSAETCRTRHWWPWHGASDQPDTTNNSRSASARRPKRPAWVIILALGVAAAVGFYLPERINVTITPSLGHRIFFLLDKPAPGEIQTGDYVVFNEIHPWSGQATTLMTKHVVCQPGDTLRVDIHRDYYCNDVYLGRSLTEDSAGTALNTFSYNGIIPAGFYFLSGGHPRSYDSRYYGLVAYDRFEHKALPIF